MKKRWILCFGLVVLLGAVLTFHPRRPLYMRSRSVNVVSADGTVLAASLSLPRWTREAVPAVVMVHGSGRRTRDHLRGDARQLVRAGIGVLAYDKRGCGASGGAYPQGGGPGFGAALRLLAQDAEAAFAELRDEDGVDPSRLGFFGASQASWIIPLAAEQLDPRPRFHVILSGAAVSTGVEDFYSRLTGDRIRTPETTDASAIRTRVQGYSGPMGFDPAPTLMALRVPTLWLLGGLDESVPTFASVRVLESMREAGNAFQTVVVYPEADHALRNARTGEPAPIWRDIRTWLNAEGILDAPGE